MTDMKIGLKDMAIAITELAVMEERHLSAAQALNRAHKAFERNESAIEKVSERLATLEKIELARGLTGMRSRCRHGNGGRSGSGF